MPDTAASHSDVLIIGAGSAGSVVAERLSIDPGCRVTIVEAGPGPDAPGVEALTADGLQLPIGGGSPLVARFDTTLTDYPARTMQVVRGATVGGSGAVNGGYFCRAVPADFVEWGVAGWSWHDVLPHYRAIETDLDYPHGGAHGDSGPVPVRRAHEIIGSTASFAQAAQDAGYQWMPDLNDGASATLPTGFGAVPSNIIDGIRTGPGAAFLEAAWARHNLRVLTGTRVWRIRIAGGRAVGVEVSGPAGQAELTADRIVLCAGAIGTAHLLMLSGIGAAEQLRAAGIPVVVPAPVGMHCADHPEWVLSTNWPVAPARPPLEVVLSLAEGIEIRPYTGGFVAMVGDGTSGHPDWPHLGVALMKPQARGQVRVSSPNPTVAPRVEHHYDSVPEDIRRLRAGTEVARELAAAAAEVGDPQWSTSQHLCGTAPMGGESDPWAVVDPRCRVRGVTGLWVIDGSVLPSVPSRGPHATTVMVAHRAAEFVREDTV